MSRFSPPTPQFQESTGETSDAIAAESPGFARDEDIDERATGDRVGWKWYATLAALVLVMIALAAAGWTFYRRANLAVERASEAQQQAERIAIAANETE